MTTSDHQESSAGLGKHRIEALSDGIFAIAMTLLVLDLKIPENIVPPGLLTRTLLALWPKFLSYVMSFALLGVFWIGHHGYSHFLKRTDRWFLWINLLFLLFVALLPFTTDLMGDNPAHRLAVMIYGANIIALGLTLYCQWSYATSGHRLVGRDLEHELVRKGKKRIWSSTPYSR